MKLRHIQFHFLCVLFNSTFPQDIIIPVIAASIICIALLFLDIPTEVFGSKLRQQVEDRLKFFETGDIPAKNVDVMVDALSEVSMLIFSF